MSTMNHTIRSTPRALTHNMGGAYTCENIAPLTHLTFSMGSALFTDGAYEAASSQVQRFGDALLGAYAVDEKFPWQYAVWVRDPRQGKGNRIQGAMAPVILDGMLGETAHTEEYVAKALGFRPDDVIMFFTMHEQLNFGPMSAAARRGAARALCGFDEYQLLKYAKPRAQWRLCDVVYALRDELNALVAAGVDGAQRALDVGTYLHSNTSVRRAMLTETPERLPVAAARRKLWSKDPSFALSKRFAGRIAEARVTWEQVYSHFGTANPGGGAQHKQNRAVWEALLNTPGLFPDVAFMRNVRTMCQSSVSAKRLAREARARSFHGIWPFQIQAAYRAAPQHEEVFDAIFRRSVALLPEGRHLGIGDASGSMRVPVGGLKGSTTAMDVAFCMVGLMSETSGLGASFSDDSWASYSNGAYLNIAKRPAKQGPLAFAMSSAIRRGMGGTQVFGAVMELITYLRRHPEVEPPDCLWFFSDMQFDPAGGGRDAIPPKLRREAQALGVGRNAPPLEVAIRLYRHAIGPVDVVLWNLAAYAPVPVPASMSGVLLVSGFDANTLRAVGRWREGKSLSAPSTDNVLDASEAVLQEIRQY